MARENGIGTRLADHDSLSAPKRPFAPVRI